MLKGMQRARHFSFYALDGGSGNARWTHEVLAISLLPPDSSYALACGTSPQAPLQ